MSHYTQFFLLKASLSLIPSHTDNLLVCFRSAYAITKGPFGGVKGRDYLAVLSLDGTLSIFEQETHTFSRFIPGFLVPGDNIIRWNRR